MTRQRVRTGMAPLEMVLVFPMLLLLVAMVFLASRAAVAKTLTVTQSRDAAWQKRKQAEPGKVLHLANNPLQSAIAGQSDRRVVAGPPLTGQVFNATTKSTLTAHTWDSLALPFNAGRKTFEPHLPELRKLTEQVPILGELLGWGLQAWILLAPDRNLALQVVAVVGRIGNVVVGIAGVVLKFVGSPPVVGGIVALELLKVPLYPIAPFSRSARRLIRYYNSVIHMMHIGLDAFDNLYQASRGRPGNWKPDDATWLGGFRP